MKPTALPVVGSRRSAPRSVTSHGTPSAISIATGSEASTPRRASSSITCRRPVTRFVRGSTRASEPASSSTHTAPAPAPTRSGPVTGIDRWMRRERGSTRSSRPLASSSAQTAPKPAVDLAEAVCSAERSRRPAGPPGAPRGRPTAARRRRRRARAAARRRQRRRAPAAAPARAAARRGAPRAPRPPAAAAAARSRSHGSSCPPHPAPHRREPAADALAHDGLGRVPFLREVAVAALVDDVRVDRRALRLGELRRAASRSRSRRASRCGRHRRRRARSAPCRGAGTSAARRSPCAGRRRACGRRCRTATRSRSRRRA